MNRISFLVSAGEKAGFGHLKRSLNLAREFYKKGFGVDFLCDDVNSFKYIPGEYFMATRPDMIVDVPIIVDTCRDVNMDYLRGNFKNIIIIDDDGSAPEGADLYVSGSAADSKSYYNGPTLRGTRYNLVDPFYATFGKFRKTKEKLENILVTTGGTNAFNVIDEMQVIIREFPELQKYNYTFIVGEYAKHEINDNHNFIYKPKDLKIYIGGSDLLISTAGTTLYEACASGLPALSIIVAKNQIPQADRLDKAGIVPCVGRFGIGCAINKKIKEYESVEKRTAISERMKQIIDGKGCERVADEIIRRFYD